MISIGFISDTHGDVEVCRRVWNDYFRNVELILHAGDILYHGPRNPILPGYNPSALAEFLNGSRCPILLARGNCDADVDQLVLNYPIQSPYVFLQIEGLRILVNHGDALEKNGMVDLARRYGVHLFVSGHTHVYSLEQVDGVILLNPGSPSLPKGDGIPSVALLEGEILKVVNINSGKILSEVKLMVK